MSSIIKGDYDNILKPTPGIYCWTDVTRKDGIFKLGMSSDLYQRLEQERSETSNPGVLIFHFILESEKGKEKEYEKWAKEWLKEKKARLCDHEFGVNASKEWYLYQNVTELRDHCQLFPYFVRSYNHTDSLPTSWGMLFKRIREWRHFVILPDSIKKAIIEPTNKSEKEDDIEYATRKKYFRDNTIILQDFVINHNKATAVKEEHQFEFTKNTNRETEIRHTYKMGDFLHDLETKRLKIIPYIPEILTTSPK